MCFLKQKQIRLVRQLPQIPLPALPAAFADIPAAEGKTGCRQLWIISIAFPNRTGVVRFSTLKEMQVFRDMHTAGQQQQGQHAAKPKRKLHNTGHDYPGVEKAGARLPDGKSILAILCSHRIRHLRQSVDLWEGHGPALAFFLVAPNGGDSVAWIARTAGFGLVTVMLAGMGAIPFLLFTLLLSQGKAIRRHKKARCQAGLASS
jgi:hypothetical protein